MVATATPAEQDLVVTRGDTCSVIVTNTTDGVTPINITGRTYAAMVRENYTDVVPAATFACQVTNAAAGQITLTLTPSQTTLDPGNYVWDLQETATSVVTTIIAGAFVVLPDATY